MAFLERFMRLFAGREEGQPDKKPGRNEPCWCGSGRKYKKCHLPEDDRKAAAACTVNCGPT